MLGVVRTGWIVAAAVDGVYHDLGCCLREGERAIGEYCHHFQSTKRASNISLKISQRIVTLYNGAQAVR